MPKLKNQLPKLCRDRNQAFSWLNGKRIYHGVYGSQEAEKSYKRFIASLLENPTQTAKPSECLVSELALSYLKHLEASTMSQTDLAHFRRVIGFLVEIYGEFAADEFTPKKLKTVRGQMVKIGTLCRRMVNSYTRRIVQIFAWGVEEELVKGATWQDLKAVKPLKKDESGTFDNPPREEIADSEVKKTLPHLSPTVATMVKLQRLTGMRPSEVYRMTVGDIDKSQESKGLWHYVLKSHKTEKRVGHGKIVPLGKPEQVLISPYLEGKSPEESVFSPKTALRERRERQRAERKTKISPSQQERNRQRAKHPAEKIGDFYDMNSYRKAIEHAIRKANKNRPVCEKIPNWTPYQLRHAAGTATEKAEGLDKAQALLGHKTANVTKRYAHGQLVIAEEMARKRVNPFDE